MQKTPKEFYRLLRPGGILAVDSFNSGLSFAWLGDIFWGERFEPTEYIYHSEFKADLEIVGFKIMDHLDLTINHFKDIYFQSQMRPIIDLFYTGEVYAFYRS